MDKLEKSRERARKRYWEIKKDPTLLKRYRLLTTKSVRKWRKNNPVKTKAQRTVFVALRNGSLQKKNCFCGEPKSQAHHEDYSKPLQVIWLCKKHHVEADAKLRALRFLSTGVGLHRYTDVLQ